MNTRRILKWVPLAYILTLLTSCDARTDADADEVCVDGLGDCFTVEGTNPACGSLPRLSVELQAQNIEVSLPNYRATLEGTVLVHESGDLTLATADGDVTITYDLGGHPLPVQVGSEIRLTWSEYRGWILNRGFAIQSSEGGLIALADDGKFGSAWVPYRDTSEFGFTVSPEMAGCALEDMSFYTTFRAALKFEHLSGDRVLVLPGDNAVVDGGGGRLFRVFNADYEFIVEARATDLAPRQAWFILAEDLSL